MAIDVDPLVDRIAAFKQRLVDMLANNDHGFVTLALGVGKEPALKHALRAALRVTLLRARKFDVVNLLGAELCAVHPAAAAESIRAEHVRSDMRHGGAAFSDRPTLL